MKVLLLLIPSLLFLVMPSRMKVLHDEHLTIMQQRANLITADMNRLSGNISTLLQGVTLGQLDEEDVQPAIDEADKLMRQKRARFERIWSEIDRIKIRAAHDRAVGQVLRSLGLLWALLAMALIPGRRKELLAPCVIGSALVLGFAAV